MPADQNPHHANDASPSPPGRWTDLDQPSASGPAGTARPAPETAQGGAVGWRGTSLRRLVGRRDRTDGDRDFLRFWGATTVSQFGSQVSTLALPLLAAVTLDATPGQMGLLVAAERLPALLLGLGAGVWVDRHRRRPLLVAADLGRTGLLGLVPLLALLGGLSMEVLYAIAFCAGTLTLVFDVAYVAYLPTIVPRDRLAGSNARLEASASVAQASGPGIAGVLVALAAAAVAVAVDAASYLASARLIRRITVPEASPPTPPPGARSGLRGIAREVAGGLGLLLRDPLLRPITLCSTTTALFGYAFLAVYVLFMTRDLHLGPAPIGAILACGGVGALGGAVLAGRAGTRLGVGPAMIWAQVVCALASALVPAAILAPAVAVPMLAAAEAIQYGTLALYNVLQLTLRQARVPEAALGRVTASHRTLVAGSIPIGGLLGGWLGDRIGLGPTLVVTIAGFALAALWVVPSPLRHLRTVADAAVGSERVPGEPHAAAAVADPSRQT